MRGVVSGKRAVTEAIRSGAALKVLVARGARKSQGLSELLAEADRAGAQVVEVDRAELDEMATAHRGVVAEVRQAEELSERDIESFPFGDQAIVVVLDGVEDPQNLGAAARSAEAAGAQMLITRIKRAAPVSGAAMRASAGALAHLPHARIANIPRGLGRLQNVGFTVVGLDASASSTIYDEPCPPGRIAVVVGSEGSGLSRLVMERCDELVAIPQLGRVESLNASASLAAVLYGYVLLGRVGG
jgi:23S rRNA (guanosine2251-2'-O)-methyltransferase